MNRQEILNKLVEIVTPWARDAGAVEGVTESTKLLDDLRINSARFVDLVLEIEDAFEVEVPDEKADQVVTLGDAADLVESLQAKQA